MRPKSVETRKYVDLSADKDFEAGVEELATELHNARRFKKPALGGVPFCVETPKAVGVAAVKVEDAESAYLKGFEIARNGDFKAWRELVRKVKQPLGGRLLEWRKQFDGAHSMEIKALPGMVLEAATIYSPLMAVALAGVESGNPKFDNQVGMLDEFLRPRDWNASGLTVIGSVPEALVFTYQGLHGATCLQIGELPLAIALSRARVARAHHFEGVVLHKDHEFTGCPESFAHSVKGAWNYLLGMFGKWPWLERIFGSAEDYKASLCAYYMSLSVQELASRLAEGRGESVESENLIMDVPVAWLRMELETQQKAYRLLIQADDSIRNIWRGLGISDKTMAMAWPKWVAQSVRWASSDNPWGFRGTPIHATLFEDVRPRDD